MTNLANAQAIKDSAERQLKLLAERLTQTQYLIKDAYYDLSAVIGKKEAQRFIKDLAKMPF